MIGNNEILNYLLVKEDFLPKPTDIGDGKMTIGSGLTDSKWLDLYRKRGNKWSKEDNRRAVLEEIQKRRLWAEQNVPHWNSLPEASQDALLSYRYNYNFTPKNSPKLFKALEDKNYLEAARQIDATSKNPDFKNGLLKRRKEEQQWFLSGFPKLSKPNNFAIPYKYPAPEYPTAAEAYRKSMTPITGNYSQGGQLQNHKQWKDLSYSEKNDIIKVAVRNGITTLPEIRQKYNEFVDEGNLYAGGGYVYDMLPQLFASDGVQVRVTSGYRPNSKVQGSGKPSRHSMHEAADIVGDFSAIRRILDNPESNTAKWMRANGYGYLDETSKTGTKKFWHDQKGDHSHYHIGKDSGIAKKFAANVGGINNVTPIVSTGNYLDIAKAHIRNNEGWSPMPVADGPKNTGWRSVGYGFNDSGFRAKYPQGISKAYENGITKAQAEQELDYILGNMDSHLRRVYGNKWNSFNDNQKAAILDTYYQRPASVIGRNSAFYNAVMRGDNNAVNYLGVTGYNTRNNDRRKLFSSAITQMPEAAQTIQQPLFYQPWNPQAANLYTPYSPLTPYPAPIFSPEEQEEYFAKQIAQAQKQQEAEQREKQRQEKADRINKFSLLMNLTDPYSSDSSSSSSTSFADAVSVLTQRSPIQYFSDGGSIHIKPENRGKFTRLKERTGHSASWFKENGTPAQKKMATFALNSRHWKHGLGGNLFEDGGDSKSGIPVTYFTQSEAMPLLADNPNRTAVLDEVTVKPYKKLPMQSELFQGITNQAANERADEYANRVTPTAEDLLNIGTLGGLNNLSPTQWARRAYDLREAIKGNMSWDKFGNNWFYGNNGLVSNKYAQEHPYASAAINLAGDIGAFGTFSALRKLPKYATLMKAENKAAQEATALNWRDMLSNSVKRTRIGDVEIDNPGLYYHQSDAGKAKNFVSTGRMRTPLEEYWLAKEEAGEHIPTKLRAGIEPGYPQDPGSAMFSQGNLWYDKLNGITVNPMKPDLLVTAKEMPIANKNASIMSDKASLKVLYEQGTRRVTNDNIYTQGPHNRQNTAAYTWEPEYGYRRVFAEETPTLNWVNTARTPQITAKNTAIITPEQWATAAQDAAYKEAVESGNRPEALRLLEQAYLNSGIPKTDITVTPDGHAVGWYHGSEWGNHTVFDSSAMNATIGGASANGKIKGNFLTTDVPSAMRYAGSDKYSSANVPEYTSPQTFSEKIKNLFGMYKPRRLYPAERVGEYAPKPERLFDTKGRSPVEHLNKVDRVVYPLYVNPGENIMRLDFQGKPWSQAPVKFPNSYKLEREIHTPEKDWINNYGDPVLEYKTETVPYKTLEEAMQAFIKDPIAKIKPENPLTSLKNQKFDSNDLTRTIEGYNSAPNYETVRLVETYTPSTTNGAVQTAAKEGKTSVLMRNVIDSNGGPNGVHYAIDDFVTLKPNQQKIADITYDDNGELIPLSQRFNWLKMNNRYSWLPWFLGGSTAATLYNKSK